MYVIFKGEPYYLISAGFERIFEDVKSTQPDLEVTIKKDDYDSKKVKIKDLEDYSVWRNKQFNTM